MALTIEINKKLNVYKFKKNVFPIRFYDTLLSMLDTLC